MTKARPTRWIDRLFVGVTFFVIGGIVALVVLYGGAWVIGQAYQNMTVSHGIVPAVPDALTKRIVQIAVVVGLVSAVVAARAERNPSQGTSSAPHSDTNPGR